MKMQKKYILVAEDETAYALVFARKLEREGFEVVVKNDGETALEAIFERKPHLIVLDLIMPKKDGFVVLEILKGHAKLKKIPVIIATNLSQDIDEKKALKAGAVDYFVKSNISITEMVGKIKRHLNCENAKNSKKKSRV